MVRHFWSKMHGAYLYLYYKTLGCIPCQEEGNIQFVIDNQVGAYSEIPQTIAQTVAGWLAPENATQLSMMSSRARALGRPDATFDIVRDLVGKY